MFDGNPIQLKSWWQELARDSEGLPFAPYKTRIIAKPAIITKAANQIILEDQHLFWKGSGAAFKRWNEYGIPMCSEDYLKGKKQGTHIYWFDQANDPDDYRPTKTKNGEIIPTLWIKIREEAKEKFKENFGSHKANEWIIFKYRSLGGDFPVRLLEHWKDNLRHGLFEGFDRFGNKTFKDEYKMGLRIKHRIFDKTRG